MGGMGLIKSLKFLQVAGDILPDSELTAVGENYLALAGKMANKLGNAMNSTMTDTIGIGVVMKLCFFTMGAVMAFHIVVAILRGMQEGHPRGIVGELFDTLWGHGPRILVFTTLSLIATGVSVVSNTGASAPATHVNYNNALVGPVFTGGTSGVQEGMAAVRAQWGKETDTVPKPMAPLKTGTVAAIRGVSALNVMVLTEKVSMEIQLAAARGQKQLTTDQLANTTTYGTTDLIGKWLVTKLVTPFFVIGEQLALIGAQYVLIKNLVANLIYMILAWRLALHFLPLMVCLAYFRSLQGFMVNAAKQLLALSIAAAAMGALAAKLFSGAFWLGGSYTNPVTGTKTNYGKGMISDLFKDIVMPASKPNSFSPGTYPWFMNEFRLQFAIIQICALFALVGVLLGEVFNITRGALDGALRSVYSTSLSSTFGR